MTTPDRRNTIVWNGTNNVSSYPMFPINRNTSSHPVPQSNNISKAKKPPTFDGNTGWQDYLVQFEMVAAVNNWDDHTKAYELTTNLRGIAQGIVTEIEPFKRFDYTYLVSALTSPFEPVNQENMYKVQMNSYYIKSGQTLPEMAQDIRRISRLAYPTAPVDTRNQLGKDCFVRALNDSKIQLFIFQREPKTIDDCIRFGVEYEAFTLDQKRINNPKTRVTQIQSVFKVSITEKLTIPPNTEVITSCAIKGHARSIMNAMTQVLPSKHTYNLLIAKAAVDPSCGQIPIRMANITDFEQIVQPDTYVAICEAVEVNFDSAHADINKLINVTSFDESKEIPSHLTDLRERSSELLSENQISQLDKLLIKYDTTFSKNKSDLGRASAIKHTISTGYAKPLKQAPRRLQLSKRDEVNDEIQRLLNCGVIEPSKSHWASCIVPVTKKSDGSTRICIDFRPLNNITIHDSYPLIRIDDALDALRGCTWLSVMDLSSGYWQVEMDEKDKEKTAFTSNKGLFHFNVMPMGLCNGVATFQRLMEYILAGLNWETCLIYIDDIIVFSDSFESHWTRLGDVLDRIPAQGLKVQHRPGKQHGNADSLSRRPCVDCNYCSKQDQNEFENSHNEPREFFRRTKKTSRQDDLSNEDEVMNIWFKHKTGREMSESQDQDLVLSQLRSLKKVYKTRPSWSDIAVENVQLKKYWSQWERIVMINDVLYRKWIDATIEQTILQLIVSNVWKQDILEMLHNDLQSGHLSIHKTTARVQNRFYLVRTQTRCNNILAKLYCLQFTQTILYKV
ncbi:unnamed protein product [Mytilus coruscus]|uniref:Reverse transcriptase domain-containing protein n=1 Tax=Mytilus coruscus TaxID=42192 RepID=A0A6J8F1R3_MYTCO|nr:unnamed protein product [Mytilus coruscus]